MQDDCFSFRLNWGSEGVAQGYMYVPLDKQVPAFWELPDTTQEGEAVGRVLAAASWQVC